MFADSSQIASKDRGDCCFNPPSVVDCLVKANYGETENDSKAMIAGTRFPRTFNDEWCGKWEHKREDSNVV
jgi:hypothetical protein